MNKFKQIVVIGALSLLAFKAFAIPITGSIGMGGGAYLVDASGARVSDASLAVGVDFIGNQFRVLSAGGDLAGVSGQIGNIQDFIFDPFSGPISAFWEVGDFSYELTGVTIGNTNNPANFLALNGTGIMSGIGFDDTLANWSFSSDTTGNGIFSWNAVSKSESNPVPEPGVLGLLALGLIGFGLRKKIV